MQTTTATIKQAGFFPSASTVPPKVRHIAGIDAIRLIAAALVMLFHYGYWTGAHPEASAIYVSQGLISFPGLYAWTDYGWVGVQVFFVISGFVIAFSGERAASAYAFFVTRAARLLPAVWICATISLAAITIVNFTDFGRLGIAYLRSLLFIPFGTYIDGSYWTLCIEVAFYALVFALIALKRFSWIKSLAVVLGLQSTVFWVVYALAAGNPDSTLFEQMRVLQNSRLMELMLLHHGCFFALGIFMWAQLIKRSSTANLMWCVLFTAAGCLQIYTVTLGFYYNFDLVQSAITPIALWLLALAAIVFSVRGNSRVHQAPPWLIRSLRTMGLMTYPLYLLHQAAGLVLMGWLVQIGMAPTAALCFTIIVAFVMAWLVSTILEPPLQKATRDYLQKLQDYAKPIFTYIR